MRTVLARFATLVALVAVTGLVVLTPDADSRGSDPKVYSNYVKTFDLSEEDDPKVFGPIRKDDKVAISSITWSSHSSATATAFAFLNAENSSSGTECTGGKSYEVGSAKLQPHVTVHLAYPKRLLLGSPNVDSRAEGAEGGDAPFWCLTVLQNIGGEVTIIG
jgi:hypothetical protein